MAADFKTTQPVEYYRKFLEQEVRPDGRELDEFRRTILNIGSISTANGSALVKLGNTKVMCGIKAELTAPKTEEPNKGFIVPNVELPPLCCSRFKPGPPSEQAQVLSQLVADVIQNSKLLDKEDLVIKAGQWVWVLYCDLLCLDYDGNINDACITALNAALRNVWLPKVVLGEETNRPEADMNVRLPLQLKSSPVACTFGIFDDCVVYADPTDEEESLATGTVTIVTHDDDKLCMMHKPGGSALSEEKLQKCIKFASTRSEVVNRLIKEALDSLDR